MQIGNSCVMRAYPHAHERESIAVVFIVLKIDFVLILLKTILILLDEVEKGKR
jgi:hypothetical protein